MIKTLKKLGIEGLYLNIIRVLSLTKPEANTIVLDGEKLKGFFSKIRNKTRNSTVCTLTQYGT
jgi:hypothetical protein